MQDLSSNPSSPSTNLQTLQQPPCTVAFGVNCALERVERFESCKHLSSKYNVQSTTYVLELRWRSQAVSLHGNGTSTEPCDWHSAVIDRSLDLLQTSFQGEFYKYCRCVLTSISGGVFDYLTNDLQPEGTRSAVILQQQDGCK